MTRDDLEQFVLQLIRREIALPTAYQMGNRDPANFQKILAGIINQPDAPSSREMLREDRDKNIK